MKNCSVKFQFITQLGRITEISVMCQRHMTFLMIDFNRLAVAAVGASGCSVSYMTHRHFALGQMGKAFGCKHLADQSQILLRYKNAVIVYHYAAAFLSAMLQGIKPVIADTGNIGRSR